MTTCDNVKGMFAVNAGDYGGSYLIVIDEQPDTVCCLRLPEKTRLLVPRSSFESGVTEKVVEFVASIDDSVYNYCKQVYEQASDIRRK